MTDIFTDIADVACRKRLEALVARLRAAEAKFIEEGSLRGVFG